MGVAYAEGFYRREPLERDPALYQLSLQHIVHRLQLVLVSRGEHQTFLLLDLDVRLRVFQVVARMDVLQRLLHGVETSCISTLLTMSNDSAIRFKCNKRRGVCRNCKLAVRHHRVGKRSTSVGFCKPEKVVEIGGRLASDFLTGKITNLPDLAGHFNYEGGFIALTAMGRRRKIRTVGLDEHAIQRDDAGRVANVLSLGEGDIAGEGNHESQIKRCTSMIDSAGEAVEDAAKSACRPVLRPTQDSSQAFSLLLEGRQ